MIRDLGMGYADHSEELTIFMFNTHQTAIMRPAQFATQCVIIWKCNCLPTKAQDKLLICLNPES
jgi:hypothetical protein